MKNAFLKLQVHETQNSPFGADSIVRGDVNGVGGGVVSDSEAEIGDAASPVTLHQNILRFEVTMGNRRLTLINDTIQIPITELKETEALCSIAHGHHERRTAYTYCYDLS